MSGARSQPASDLPRLGDGQASPKSQDFQQERYKKGGNLTSRINERTLANIVHRLYRLPALRQEAIHAQIAGREKKCEVGYRRRDVSDCDAKFMRELQALIAQGKLHGFDNLLKLGDECQKARDTLGPLEEETIEADQEWEWRFSKLEQAEESAYEAFDSQSANLYPSGPPSLSSSQYESSTDNDSQYLDEEFNDTEDDIRYQQRAAMSPSNFPPPTPPRSPTTTAVFAVLAELDLNEISPKSGSPNGDSPHQNGELESTSGLSGNIDRVAGGESDETFAIPLYRSHRGNRTNIEYYPSLLTDFVSVRERVTQWLMHNLLLSRWEVALLKDRLEAEGSNLPSNWAQLVVAFWAKDMPANPSQSVFVNRQTTLQGAGSTPWHDVQTMATPIAPQDEQPPVSERINYDDSDGSTTTDGGASRSTFFSDGILSQTSNSNSVEASHEFVTLLLQHEDLKPLFRQSFEFVDASQFGNTERFIWEAVK
jgi:hypothetical protein